MLEPRCAVKMFLLKSIFSSGFWLCYPRTHLFQWLFTVNSRTKGVPGCRFFFLAPLLSWKWFLLIVWSCEGKWSVIDCNSRLKTMFVCLLLLKVGNVVTNCPQVADRRTWYQCSNTHMVLVHYQFRNLKYDLETEINSVKYLLNAMKCPNNCSWLAKSWWQC